MPRLRRLVPALAIAAASLAAYAGTSPRSDNTPRPAWLDPYREPAARLIGAAYADHAGWAKLAELTDRFGPRLSGTPALEAAIAWAAARMAEEGLERVRTEPVSVPRWIRGRESLEVVRPFPRPLAMLGLGGSVGTPPNGLEARALVVDSFQDLEARAAEVRGRIVVYNVPYTTYGETVQYRTSGASRAAQLGAVAALVRSVGPTGLRTPHTGALRYTDGQPRIPAAAIAAEDAESLARLQALGEPVTLRLRMEARTEADVASANLLAELVGRERPEEIVVVGGHFDSWDVGTGASDDGVGCIVAWEAVRLMRTLGLRPRRTVRVVLFTNEENGLRGGLAYRDRHIDELPRHVMMLESDSGVFPPVRIGVSGSDQARAMIRDIATLLVGIDAHRVDPQGGGADIGPSVQAAGIPAVSLNGDPGRYFLIHHTPADTVDRIDPQDVSRAIAAVAVVSYIVADVPDRFGVGTR
jgi:carboxypeptidase Q